jgi:hypothetical protein
MSVVPPGLGCAGFINIGGAMEGFEFMAPHSTGPFSVSVGATNVSGLWDTTLDSVAFTIPGPGVNSYTELKGYAVKNERAETESWAMAGQFERFVYLPQAPGWPPRLVTSWGGWYAEFDVKPE